VAFALNSKSNETNLLKILKKLKKSVRTFSQNFKKTQDFIFSFFF